MGSAARVRPDRRRAGMAETVGRARRRHLRERPAGPPRPAQRVRRRRRALPAPETCRHPTRGPRRATGRAVRLHGRRRPRGVPGPAVRARLRPASDLVRSVARGGSGGADPAATLHRVTPAFDPWSPSFVAHPYDAYAHLRDEAPVSFFEPTGQWLISRYEDVNALLRDRRLGR